MDMLSITALSELTGCDRRTVKKRLTGLTPEKKGRSHAYNPQEALPLIYMVEHGFDLTQERARLSHHQANKTALEEQTLKGELIPAEDVLKQWSKLATSFRAKMLAIPTKASHLLLNIKEFSVAESILKSHIHDALKELSENHR